jgi:cytochrome P450
MTTSPSPSPTFSFFDPEYRKNPYPVLARLRATDPVHETDYAWILTRHADVVRVHRDPRCGRDTRKLQSGGMAARLAAYPGLMELLATWMIHLDPPDQTRIRKLFAYAFTPRAVEQMEVSVRKVSDRLLAALPETGEFDLMKEYAKPLPLTVICELMDVPREERPMLEGYSEAIAEHLEITASPAQLSAADRAFVEFKDYLARFVARRRRSPGAGLVDRLIAAEAETDALSSDELLSNVMLLLIAGHETTTNLIGNGMHALLRHPDELVRLRQRPDLTASAVEESLRYDSPGNTNARCPHEDIEVGGKLIGAGQLVLCMIGAANRDPEVFQDPDRFDVSRSPNPHQAFGGGAHYCMGAPLARLEGRIAFRGLLERYSSIELDPDRVRWRDRINLRGLSELGLRVRRSPRTPG